MRSSFVKTSLLAVALFAVFVPLGMNTVRGNVSLHTNIVLAADACTSYDASGTPVQSGTVVHLPGGTDGCRDSSGKIFVHGQNGEYIQVNEQGMILDENGNSTGVNVSRAIGRPGTCTGIVDCITSLPSALWQAAVTLLAGSLIEISRWFLIAAGSLFNWLMDHTIIQFGALYAIIKTAIETAWTAFRDVANILIIGIFTFVAIGTILGLQTYNAKKMVAKVLIVAVLINFSLLATKMLIDASNYTAAQIYTAAALGGTASTQGGQAGAATAGTRYGIADQFLNLLGVGTVGNAFKVVDDTAQAKDSGWAALLHGVLVMVVILGAAMVLFYGCFLLVSRMIMLIFLMGTASIAVASLLIPDWSEGRFGWTAWKSSLIWCVTFGPILMILLWMTLNVAYALKGAPGATKATLGAGLSDPAGGGNIEAIFIYIVVLGLLFGTFKISSMWAGKIGGFSYAAFLPALGVAGAGRLAGILGKNTVGRGAGYLSRRAGDAALAHDKAGNYGRGAFFKSIANQLEKPTKRDFNMMNTKFGKDITGIAGLKGAWAGETKGKGVEEDDKKAAEVFAKRAEKAAESSRKDLEKGGGAMLKEAARSIADLPENRERKKQLRTMEETAKAQLEQSKKSQEANKEALTKATERRDSEKTAAETAIKKSEENMKTVVAQLERDKEYTPEGSDARKDMDRQIAAARAEHESNMNSEKAKISNASAEVARIQSLAKANADAISGAEKSLADIAKDNEKFEKEMEAKALDNVSAEKIAGKMVTARLTNILGTGEDKDNLTALTRKHIRETGEEKNIKKILKKQVEEAEKAEKEPAKEAEKPAEH